jgi:hypothetical protein
MTSSIERPIWDHPHTSRNTDHSAAILDDSLFKREDANLSVQDLKERNSEVARLDCCSKAIIAELPVGLDRATAENAR